MVSMVSIVINNITVFVEVDRVGKWSPGSHTCTRHGAWCNGALLRTVESTIETFKRVLETNATLPYENARA